MKAICSICARGGSKGVPNKNVRPLNGKPLVAYSVEQALASGLFEIVSVSSDSDAILEAARVAGASLLVHRPAELATDSAPKLPVIQHCVLESEKHTGSTYDVVVDLDATSPLRNAGDIVSAYRLLVESDAQNVITGMPARRSPYFNLVELGEDGLARLSKSLSRPVVRRQDAPACFDMNASIYVWRRESLMMGTSVFMDRTRLYVMPEERSIDIDSELDFLFVEYLLQRRFQGRSTS